VATRDDGGTLNPEGSTLATEKGRSTLGVTPWTNHKVTCPARESARQSGKRPGYESP
jgi:hypothetical protein